MRPITVIGIDPGASGALCFASSEKKDMYTYKCHPSIAGRRWYYRQLFNPPK